MRTRSDSAGLTIHGHPSWGHNGGAPGAQAQVDVFEDSGLTLIVMSNQDDTQRPGLRGAASRRTSMS